MSATMPFIPQRLTQARKMSGLSLRALSEKLGNTPSHTILARYEKGIAAPNSEMLARLAHILEVSPDFFYSASSVSLDGIHFRKRSKLSKSAREAIEERAKDYFARFMEIEDITNNTIFFDTRIQASTVDEAEQAAYKLRDMWNMGEDPVVNLLQLMENKGIKIFIVDIHDFTSFLRLLIRYLNALMKQRTEERSKQNRGIPIDSPKSDL